PGGGYHGCLRRQLGENRGDGRLAAGQPALVARVLQFVRGKAALAYHQGHRSRFGQRPLRERGEHFSDITVGIDEAVGDVEDGELLQRNAALAAVLRLVLELTAVGQQLTAPAYHQQHGDAVDG